MKYKDYVPLPNPGERNSQHKEIVDWIEKNVKVPKWSWSRSSSKIYKRALRPTIRLGVYLPAEDALALRLKFDIRDFKK